MLLDLYRKDQSQAASFMASRPVEALDPGFGGAFSASWNALRARQSAGFESQARVDIVAERLEAYRAATGQDLANPELATVFPPTLLERITPTPGWYEEAQNTARNQTITAYNAWATANNQPLYPTPEELDALVLQRRLEVYQESQEVLAGARTGAAGFGAFTGEIAGAMYDPIIAASMAFGAPLAAGIVRTALIEAGVGFGSDLLSQVANLDRIRQVEPEWGLGEIFGQAAMSGVGGAVFGGAIKGIAAVWSAVRDRTYFPQRTRDAGRVVEEEAAVATGIRPATAREAAAARQSTEQATLDLGQDRPVTVAPAAAAVAGARTGRVFASDGTVIEVQYEVVPLSTLVASHDGNLVVNPAYPPELQPRDRTRAASADQLTEIIAKFEPERFAPTPAGENGPMIVGPDNIVDSGNMRTIVLSRVYAENGTNASRYRAFLEAQGFDIADIDQPVLVARRTSQMDMPTRATVNTALNRSAVAGMGTVEQAVADARALDTDLLSRLRPGEVGAAANRDFVRGFAERMPSSERAKLFDDDGSLSVDGLRRVQAALLARAFGDKGLLGRVLEDTDNNIRAAGGALSDAAGSWAIMRDAVAAGEVPRGMDVTSDVLDAVRTIMRARDEGRPIAELLAQGEMFGGLSELGKFFLRGMFKPAAEGRAPFRVQESRASIAAMLRGYADEAMTNREGGLFADVARSADEVLAGVLERRGGTPDMFEQVKERTTPEAIEKLANDPAIEKAIVRQAVDLAQTPRGGNGVGADMDATAAAVADLRRATKERLSPADVRRLDQAYKSEDVADASIRPLRDAAYTPAAPMTLYRAAGFHSGALVNVGRSNSAVPNMATAVGIARGVDGAMRELEVAEIRVAGGTMALSPDSGIDLEVVLAPDTVFRKVGERKAEQGGWPVRVSIYAAARTADGLPSGALRTVPMLKEDGTFEDRLLDEVLAEADAEIAAARDIEACATGKPLPSAQESML